MCGLPPARGPGHGQSAPTLSHLGQPWADRNKEQSGSGLEAATAQVPVGTEDGMSHFVTGRKRPVRTHSRVSAAAPQGVGRGRGRKPSHTPHASASATGLPPRAHTRVDPSSSSMATTSHSLVGASPLRGLCRVTSILLSPREASSHAASCPVEAPWHEAQGGISQWPSRN